MVYILSQLDIYIESYITLKFLEYKIIKTSFIALIYCDILYNFDRYGYKKIINTIYATQKKLTNVHWKLPDTA